MLSHDKTLQCLLLHFYMQGDRAGICVTQFDPKLLERGTICTPGALPTIEGAIISVKKIPYYKVSLCMKGNGQGICIISVKSLEPCVFLV